LTWAELTALVLACAVAFGKATFTFFLTKWQAEAKGTEALSLATTTVHNIDEKIVHEIQERRDGHTFEPTP